MTFPSASAGPTDPPAYGSPTYGPPPPGQPPASAPTPAPVAAPPPGTPHPPAALDSTADPWSRPRAGQPGSWERPAVAALLLVTALLYLWGLGESGWANAFYSAAAQAGSESWKAFFFGSSDAGNSITVDKTPASLWLMALSVRIFGLNSWSILVPEALCGVAAVGMLYLAVRRWFGPAAGLLAGAVMALTPVAVLMFRFNNPDALLVLLLVAAAYAVTRALETGGTRWLVLAGALVGFGFLTKMLQALLVVPAFGLVYLIAGPTSLRRRLWQLAAGLVAMVVAAGWWIAIVELVPASARPYIGGSQHNSILELTFGYNGFGRLTGDEVGSVTGGGGGPGGGQGGQWGQTGLFRLFDTDNGGQISWLLPAAMVLLVALVGLTWRAPRLDRTRSATVLWGGWLVVTGLTFSLMAGIFHPYYSVALAPAVGAVIGIGAVTAWRSGTRLAAGALALAVAAGSVWSFVLLGRSAEWLPWLRPLVLVGGLVCAVSVAVIRLAQVTPARGPAGELLQQAPQPSWSPPGGTRPSWGSPPAWAAARDRVTGVLRDRPWAVPVVLGAATAFALAGPAAYAVQTASTPHSGSIPSAGPAVSGGRGFGGRGPGGNGLPGNGLPGSAFPGNGLPGFGPGADGRRGRVPGGTGGPGGALGGNGSNGGGRGRGGIPGPGGGPGGGGLGGLLDAGRPSAELVAFLQKEASNYRWVAAAVGANTAAGLQLGSREPVMPIGGFNGSDPSPTLAQFQQYVHDGQIHYFVGGGGFGSNGGSQASAQIAAWVTENFTAQTVGGVTLYDLTAPRS